jgi:hypothetical protein
MYIPVHPWLKNSTMTYIVTHPGSAHKDDFLACGILAAEFNLPIVRRDPSEAELQNPEFFVVDVGGSHDPELRNFDHHQFPSDHPPTCSLSLVLTYLGLYEDAVTFCPWMKTAEWLDARGARQTAEWLEVDPFVVTQLSSPIDFSVLRYFANEQELDTHHPMWKLMSDIGGDILTYLRSLRRHLNELQDQVEFWQVGGLEFAFLSRDAEVSSESSSALGMFVREQDREIIGIISPDQRGQGYGLKRFDDDLRLDFTRIQHEPDVHFAHKQGFIAKTSATDPEELRKLVGLSID